tara:strand:- start:53 stop:484 length:432 start_codon:yes stop_codon:yes gene_type:complete
MNTIKNEKATSPKVATPSKARKPIPVETAGGGGLNPNLKLILSEAYYDSGCHASLPKQVRLAMAMVWNDFGGQCTIGELDKAWDSSEYIDTNGGKYTQGIITKAGQKSFMTHYFSGGVVTRNVTDRKDAFTKEQYQEHIVITK